MLLTIVTATTNQSRLQGGVLLIGSHFQGGGLLALIIDDVGYVGENQGHAEEGGLFDFKGNAQTPWHDSLVELIPHRGLDLVVHLPGLFLISGPTLHDLEDLHESRLVLLMSIGLQYLIKAFLYRQFRSALIIIL